MQLVDSHCHLPLIDAGERGLAGVIRDAGDNGVSHMLCVCVDLATSQDVLDVARAWPNVSCSIGVHPNTGEDREDPGTAALVQLGAHPEVVAIGESGLDYFRSRGDLDWQRGRFRSHIRAARELSKPLIVHTRESAADALKLLRQERAQDVGGVMHCFVEDWDTASEAMDLGFYISFSGIVTFDNTHALRDVAARVPLERLLVETDAPWLAPVPRRGRQNEPAYARYTAECLARVRELPPEDLARATSDNFFELFRLAVR